MIRAPFLMALFGLFLLGSSVALVASACGDDDDGPMAEADPDPEADPEAGRTQIPDPAEETVKVSLKEWAVVAGETSVTAGVIEFLADNEGTREHELVIRLAGKDDELAEVDGIMANNLKSLKIRLTPGKYELACLINADGQDHYENGMKATFEVK